MNANVLIDDDLLRAAMRLSRANSEREVIDLALREYVSRHAAGSRPDTANAEWEPQPNLEVLMPLPEFPGRIPSGWRDSINF